MSNHFAGHRDQAKPPFDPCQRSGRRHVRQKTISPEWFVPVDFMPRGDQLNIRATNKDVIKSDAAPAPDWLIADARFT
jgi:hypothetical protein